MRIMIVEDERIIAMDIKLILNQLGITDIIITNNGDDAIKNTEESDFDLIIMDINILGNKDGIQTAKIIQENRDIPILFCSAYHDKETLRHISNISYIGFLEKPIEENELARYIISRKAKKHKTRNDKIA